MRLWGVLWRAVLIVGCLLAIVLTGCTFTEPSSGCQKYVSDPFFSGKEVVAYQCWGDAVPADSLDHPEWW